MLNGEKINENICVTGFRSIVHVERHLNIRDFKHVHVKCVNSVLRNIFFIF